PTTATASTARVSTATRCGVSAHMRTASRCPATCHSQASALNTITAYAPPSKIRRDPAAGSAGSAGSARQLRHGGQQAAGAGFVVVVHEPGPDRSIGLQPQRLAKLIRVVVTVPHLDTP